jgi:hypothetical protein
MSFSQNDAKYFGRRYGILSKSFVEVPYAKKQYSILML